MVGVGEKTAFRVFACMAQSRHDFRVIQTLQGLHQHRVSLDAPAQLRKGLSLDQGQRVLHHPAPAEQPKQRARRQVARERIFPGLELVCCLHMTSEQDEEARVPDDALRMQFMRKLSK